MAKRSTKKTTKKPAGKTVAKVAATARGEVDQVVFEAGLRTGKRRSMFDAASPLTADNLDEFKPAPGSGVQAANALRALGFAVRHIGTYSISAEASRAQWEKVFGTKVEPRRQ